MLVQQPRRIAGRFGSFDWPCEMAMSLASGLRVSPDRVPGGLVANLAELHTTILKSSGCQHPCASTFAFATVLLTVVRSIVYTLRVGDSQSPILLAALTQNG